MRVLPPGNSTGTLYFLHSDHPSTALRTSLGSVSAVTDLSGSVIARQWYYPYGAVRASTGALPTDITFTAQRSDATGLYFYNARYYSGVLGRFISADTIVPEPGNPQALNRYAYVFNNPLKYLDPSGHDPCGGPGVHVPDCGVEGWGLKPGKTKPSSPASSVPLTPKGAQMLALCQAYYGGSCNTQDFLARGLTPEFKTIVFRRGDPTASSRVELLAHATTHAVYMKCRHENGGRSCSGLSTNAILNWMGGYSQTSYNMYRKWATGSSLTDAVPQLIHPIAQQVAASVLNPLDPEWTKAAYIDSEPGSWGNASLYRIPEALGGTIEAFLETQGLGAPLWIYGDRDNPNEDLFYVLTVAQTRALQPYRKP
jgi:RHS repeat-associated protein